MVSLLTSQLGGKVKLKNENGILVEITFQDFREVV